MKAKKPDLFLIRNSYSGESQICTQDELNDTVRKFIIDEELDTESLQIYELGKKREIKVNIAVN